jgi:hypothetical protein
MRPSLLSPNVRRCEVLPCPIWKQAMSAAGLKLPTQAAEGRAVCFCGAAIGLKDMDAHVYGPKSHEIRRVPPLRRS